MILLLTWWVTRKKQITLSVTFFFPFSFQDQDYPYNSFVRAIANIFTQLLTAIALQKGKAILAGFPSHPFNPSESNEEEEDLQSVVLRSLFNSSESNEEEEDLESIAGSPLSTPPTARTQLLTDNLSSPIPASPALSLSSPQLESESPHQLTSSELGNRHHNTTLVALMMECQVGCPLPLLCGHPVKHRNRQEHLGAYASVAHVYNRETNAFDQLGQCVKNTLAEYGWVVII